jgi:hypothetical protein
MGEIAEYQDLVVLSDVVVEWGWSMRGTYNPE